MLPELTQDEFSAALDAVAADILMAGGREGSPVDALELARALHLAVAWDATQLGRGRIVRLSGFDAGQARGSILVRPEPRRERLHWTVAHEIGESCAYQVFDRLRVDPRKRRTAPRDGRQSARRPTPLAA